MDDPVEIEGIDSPNLVLLQALANMVDQVRQLSLVIGD